MRAPSRLHSPWLLRNDAIARWSWPILGVGLALIAEPIWGFQRTVRVRVANYEETPVVVQAASAQLVQTYSHPGQFPLAEVGGEEVQVKRSRVRYVNKLNQEIPIYVLEGELTLRNHTHKEVAVLQLTTVFLNAFRERIATEQQSVTEVLRPLETRVIRWSRSLPHQEIFELYVIVTRVRFSDGTIWTATEELILIP